MWTFHWLCIVRYGWCAFADGVPETVTITDTGNDEEEDDASHADAQPH